MTRMPPGCYPRFVSAAAFSAYLLAAALVIGCERAPSTGSAPSRPAAGAEIAILGACETDPTWPAIRGGAQRYFAGAPAIRATCAAPPEPTPDSLATLVTRLLDQRPAVVCVHVVDLALARPAIERSLASQALVVTMGQRSDIRGVSRHIDVDWTGGAEQLGANLTRVAAGRRSYLLVHDDGRSEVGTTCYQRFNVGAQYQYDLVLLQAATPSAEQSTARVVEELLGRFSHAGLLVTLNPDVWLTAPAGWNLDLRQRNRDFRFVTLSAAPLLWPRLGTPEAPGEAAALVGPLDGDIGFAAAEAATRLLLSPGTKYSHAAIPCELVLPEDLPDFARRYSAAAGGLDVSAYLPRSLRPAGP